MSCAPSFRQSGLASCSASCEQASERFKRDRPRWQSHPRLRSIPSHAVCRHARTAQETTTSRMLKTRLMLSLGAPNSSQTNRFAVCTWPRRCLYVICSSCFELDEKRPPPAGVCEFPSAHQIAGPARHRKAFAPTHDATQAGYAVSNCNWHSSLSFTYYAVLPVPALTGPQRLRHWSRSRGPRGCCIWTLFPPQITQVKVPRALESGSAWSPSRDRHPECQLGPSMKLRLKQRNRRSAVAMAIYGKEIQAWGSIAFGLLQLLR